MKRRYVFAGFALVAALAVVSPALGGPSLRSLVKSEVAKQLSTAQTAKKGKRDRQDRGSAWSQWHQRHQRRASHEAFRGD